MLDMKRTFDEVVLNHSTPDKAEQILANPFYQALSSSFAGTQEYMAMEKLGQLRGQMAEGTQDWDLVVVDTPDALLVTTRARAQDVKQVVATLPATRPDLV